MRRHDRRRRAPRPAALGLLALLGCATPGGGPPHQHGAAPVSAAFAALVAAPDRTAADLALDPGRKPAEMLTFLDVRPGMRVADLGAGGGYTTELLARAVGPTGTVYSQNPKGFVSMVGQAWNARLARPALARVVPVVRDFDEPLPFEAHQLDLVVMNVVYHDTVWLRTDRPRMNRAIFDAVAPGGALVIIDSSAADGGGETAAYELHRIEESLVRAEVTSVGFRLVGTSEFLRNPDDARDWNPAPNEAGARRGTSDRFALRFVKP
jgi:predicted methyltransferase